MQRLHSVESCLDPAKPPKYDYDRVQKDGYDVSELRYQFKVLVAEQLPEYVSQMHKFIIDISNDLQVAGVHAVDAILGRVDPHEPPELQNKFHCDIFFDAEGDNPALQMYDHVHKVLRLMVHFHLHELEEFAITACLDGVGWCLPNDDDTVVEKLQDCVDDRVVKPLRGGIEVWRDGWIANKDCHGRIEWVDRLDTAEMEDYAV